MEVKKAKKEAKGLPNIEISKVKMFEYFLSFPETANIFIEKEKHETQKFSCVRRFNSFKSDLGQQIIDDIQQEKRMDVEIRCTCTKTRCLKLCCKCFKAKKLCKGCSCSCCFNSKRTMSIVEDTQKIIEKHNPYAFASEICEQIVFYIYLIFILGVCQRRI